MNENKLLPKNARIRRSGPHQTQRQKKSKQALFQGKEHVLNSKKLYFLGTVYFQVIINPVQLHQGQHPKHYWAILQVRILLQLH